MKEFFRNLIKQGSEESSMRFVFLMFALGAAITAFSWQKVQQKIVENNKKEVKTEKLKI